MKNFASVVLLLFMLMALTFQPAQADVAPPEAPPGSNPLPGENSTQVAMLAETVTLNISADPADKMGAIANTVALFTMHNQGNTVEQIQVRFPLSFLFWGSDRYPEIGDLVARVNGRKVQTTRQVLPYTPVNPVGGECVDCPVAAHRQTQMPWAVFDVSFPPGEDVSIEVSYTVQGYGYAPYEEFRYILETGAGWKNTIGSADVIVRLPYEANARNIWVETSTSGLTFSGTEARWHFENLEPSTQNNIEISLVAPGLWQKVLSETATVTQNPQDGEAWGRLGKAYKEIIRMSKGYLRDDKVGEEMYALSRDAYERCLSLLPKDSLWHAGFADLLWSRYYFDMYFSGEADTEGILPRLLSELRIALELDPNNQVAQDLLSWIASSSPELVHKTDSGYDFLALTATPTPQITYETLTAAPTGTPFPSPLPVTLTVREMTQESVENPTQEVPSDTTPIPTQPQDAPANPLCGGTAMLLSALMGTLWFVRRRQG